MWQTTDEDPHRVGGVEPPNTIRGKDVDHSRSETAVSQDGHTLTYRLFVQRPLLPHDFSVASQIREVQAGIDGESRELEIEVVGNRTHYRVVAYERLTHGSSIAHIQLDASKSVSLELL